MEKEIQIWKEAIKKSNSEIEKMIVDDFYKTVSIRAFDAALAYEKNCRAKYDRFNKPSLPIPKGEQMSDYARAFGTTVQEMKECEFQVEHLIGKNT